MTAEASDCFADIFFSSPDGLKLYARDYRPANADATGAPIVCLAGLSRNSRDFHLFAAAISQSLRRRVVALDYRGRGRSQRDANTQNYTIAVEAADVVAALDALGIERAAFVGTSRGGLILHGLAVAVPRRIERVVLNDIGPVIEAEGLQEIAAYLSRSETPKNWDDAAEILRRVHGAAFPALSAADWSDMAHAIYVEQEGRIAADFDPAIAEQLAAMDLTGPLPDLWAQFQAFDAVPLMAIRGEHSRLLSKATLAEMQIRHPGLASHVADGQGHAPLLHRPDVLAAIGDFLGKT